jgi:hypothetical protein
VSGGLAGNTAVVTGTAHGTGTGIADALRGGGVKVHGVGKDTADLSVSAAAAEFFAGAGPVDILVNCAGGVAGQVGRPLEEVTDVVRWPRSSSVPPPRFAASWRSPCLGLSWVVFCRTAAWIRQVSHRGQVSTGRARQGRPRQVPGQLPDLLPILTINFGRRAYTWADWLGVPRHTFLRGVRRRYRPGQ